MSSDVVVIGAGPAGLGAALSLGKAATVLEARPTVAGLSSTIVHNGVVFDLGGHSFHTPHPDIRKLVFDALPMEEQSRQAWVWLDGDWVRYPFQKYFHELQTEEIRRACEAGLTSAAGWESAANFDEHLSARFGSGIAEHFMRPYNRKLWGHDLQRMEADWTAERVAAPRGTTERFESSGGKRKPLQADTKIAYPSRGGFGEIFCALARQVPNLRLGQSIASIDPVRHRLSTASGDTFGWDTLVSTLALPRLLGLLPDVPAEIGAAAARLEALPVNLVMITFDRQLSTPRQRVYNPGAQIPGHKIVLNNTSSNWLRAQSRHGIQVEVSETTSSGGLNTNPQDLTDKVVAGLLRMGLIPSADVVDSAEVLRLPYGYPVPTHERGSIVASIKQWLKQRGIFTVGRFGEWAYINADEALHRGVRLGSQLATGTAE